MVVVLTFGEYIGGTRCGHIKVKGRAETLGQNSMESPDFGF